MDSDRQLMEHQKDKSKSMYFSDESIREEQILENYIELLRIVNSAPAGRRVGNSKMKENGLPRLNMR